MEVASTAALGPGSTRRSLGPVVTWWKGQSEGQARNTLKYWSITYQSRCSRARYFQRFMHVWAVPACSVANGHGGSALPGPLEFPHTILSSAHLSVTQPLPTVSLGVPWNEPPGSADHPGIPLTIINHPPTTPIIIMTNDSSPITNQPITPTIIDVVGLLPKWWGVFGLCFWPSPAIGTGDRL